MIQTKPRHRHEALRRPAQRAMTVKWIVVFAALAVATVLDGLSIAEMAEPNTSGLAAITLPAEHCEPGCTIMMASNQSGDAFATRSR